MKSNCDQFLISVLVILSQLHNHIISAFFLPPQTKSSSLSSFSARTTFTTVQQQQQQPSSSSSLEMCICINCKYVTNCAAYHFVETKHEQPHMTSNPTFEPRDGSPTIHVNVRTIRTREDREKEIERMWREHEEQTKLAVEKAGGNEGADGERLMGETTYDLTPVTTYEYDVVKCEDYVHEEGCWVKNMPEEIKLANPNFVPS